MPQWHLIEWRRRAIGRNKELTLQSLSELEAEVDKQHQTMKNKSQWAISATAGTRSVCRADIDISTVDRGEKI